MNPMNENVGLRPPPKVGVNSKLEAISNHSKKGGRVNNLYRLMCNPNIWGMAYQNIYSNKGATTKGIDNNTLDGFSIERVNNLIGKLKKGVFKPKAVRRVYIPKPDGKKRPLGIPTGDDKLVQEVVKIILESIYEPIFSNNSHGFRQNRSCHTSLEVIKEKWNGMKWLIDFDIKGYYDNIDHKILVKMLEKRINDKRFINLIKSMLKSGYMEDWKFHRTYSGVPQGGVVSPILANIYLHELDIFVEKKIKRFSKGKGRKCNKEYRKYSDKITRRRKKIDRIRKIRGKNTKEEKELIKEIKELDKVRKTIPGGNQHDPNYRRMWYIRYADDFLIGTICSKEETLKLQEEIRDFIEKELNLKISEEKSGINHARDGSHFLGYNIEIYSDNKTQKRKVGRWTPRVRIMSGKMTLHIPREKKIRFCKSNGYGNLDKFRARVRPELLNHSDLEIISTYNSELRGLANYYSLAYKVKSNLSKLNYLAEISLTNTLAEKHKCSRGKIYSWLGRKLEYRYKHGDKEKTIKFFRMKDFTPKTVNYGKVDSVPKVLQYASVGGELIQRMNAGICEYCGTEEGKFEVHHVRKLSDVKKGTEIWKKVMIARQRKTLVLCRECHDLLHSGKLPDRRFGYFTEMESRMR